MFPNLLREFDELCRAGGGRNPPRQHEVVGRVLALAAQSGSHLPRQRVEPPEAAQRFGRHLQQPVTAARVGKLVQQHDAHPLGRPPGRRRRQHHRRPPPTPGRHQPPTRTEQQVDPATQAARPREAAAQPMPRPLRHTARRDAEPAESRQPDQQHTGAGRHARQPDRDLHRLEVRRADDTQAIDRILGAGRRDVSLDGPVAAPPPRRPSGCPGPPPRRSPTAGTGPRPSRRGRSGIVVPLELVLRQRHRHRQQARRVEPRLHLRRAQGAAHEQPGAQQQFFMSSIWMRPGAEQMEPSGWSRAAALRLDLLHVILYM